MSGTKKMYADFNGLFQGGTVLCLSHGDTSTDETGATVILCSGMHLTAYMDDLDDAGNRDDLIASGVVEQAPEWLRKHGSKWILAIDENGVRHQSEIQEEPAS
jgi:hypothetical protein